jgi:UDP-glucose 4-epimerase
VLPSVNVKPPIHEENLRGSVSPYGASKLAGEGYCSAYYRSFDDSETSFVFALAMSTVPVQAIKAACGRQIHSSSDARTKMLRYTVMGTQTRDFIYIEDLINAICKASVTNTNGETFQIATSKEHTVNEVANIIKLQLKKYGFRMSIEYSEQRKGDVKRNYSDTTKASKILLWKAKTELTKGIEFTVNWFLQKR